MLRLSCEPHCLDESPWKSRIARPQAQAQAWLRKVAGDTNRGIMDTLGFAESRGPCGGKPALTSLCRATITTAAKVIGCSGAEGWFCEPIRWADPLPADMAIPPAVEWLRQEDDEDYVAYLAAAVARAGLMGLARGQRQLGIRGPRAEEEEAASEHQDAHNRSGLHRSRDLGAFRQECEGGVLGKGKGNDDRDLISLASDVGEMTITPTPPRGGGGDRRMERRLNANSTMRWGGGGDQKDAQVANRPAPSVRTDMAMTTAGDVKEEQPNVLRQRCRRYPAASRPWRTQNKATVSSWRWRRNP